MRLFNIFRCLMKHIPETQISPPTPTYIFIISRIICLVRHIYRIMYFSQCQCKGGRMRKEYLSNNKAVSLQDANIGYELSDPF